MRHSLFLFLLLLASTITAQQTEMNITSSDGIGINIENPTTYFQIEVPDTYPSHGLLSKINITGNTDRKAIEGFSITNPGYGIGGFFTGGFKGIYGHADGGNYDGSGFALFGVHARATGTTGTRVGLFAEASGGDKNIAARFGSGDVEIHNNTYIGEPSDSLGRLHVFNSNTLHNGNARAGYFYTLHDGDDDAYGVTSIALSNGTGMVYGQRNSAFGFQPTSKVYGTYSTAVGTNGEMIGLYSSAAGGSINLAAKFGSGDVEVDDRLRVNTPFQNGRVHIKNTDNIGSNATAVRIEATNDGAETAYGTFVTASNSGSGAAIGNYSAVYSDGDLAYYGIGNSYFTGDVRIGQNVDPYVGEYKVVVDGKILSEEVRVQNSLDWPDYVFSDSYDLRSLQEVESFIKENSHLPNIPSADEIEKEGIILGVMQTKMMEKIEELTLYIIAQQKEIDTLKTMVKTLTDEK